jgi:cytochrome P450
MSESDAPREPWEPEGAWEAFRSGATDDFAGIYQAARTRCPVAWRSLGEGQGHWTALDHDVVDEILADPDRFSSAIPKYGAPMIPIEVDPPEHGQYRLLLTRLINPARVQVLEGEVRQNIVAQLERVLDGGQDLLAATEAIPLRAFCMLVGEPDPDEWKAISHEREARTEGRLALLDAESTARRIAALKPIRDYCARQIAARRACPGDDLVSDILAGHVFDRPITDDEALRILTLIYVAGHRTTTAALRGAVIQLARHPEVQAALRAEPAGIPVAIEEILRLETPVHGLPRYVTRDTELAGRRFAKGDQIFPNYGAANVDPAAFPDPATFNAKRKPNRHLAFGRGIHVCAGAPLARLQLKIFLQELLARGAPFALQGPVERATWPHFGAVTLPVTLRRA